MEKILRKNRFGDVVFFTDPKFNSIRLSKTGATNIQIAEDFIGANQSDIGLSQVLIPGSFELKELSDISRPALSLQKEKQVGGTAIVVYEQTFAGIPVFDARVGIQINNATREVMSSQSSAYSSIELKNSELLKEKKSRLSNKITKKRLEELLGFKVHNLQSARLNGKLIYRYDESQRSNHTEAEHENHGCFGEAHSYNPKLQKLSKSVSDGQHYVVYEILWRGALKKGTPPVNWRSLVEPTKGDLLYIRALVACVTGLVYEKDPQTQTGDIVLASASTSTLDSYRNNETLHGLVSNSPQDLVGEFVEIVDHRPIIAAPPTVPSVPGHFAFSADTDDFSAVNAYFHVDRCFRTMQEYGYNIASYFSGTTFPIPVDHRGVGGVVNANCPGNTLGNGIGEMNYGLIGSGSNLGIASSNRVVWHEFGHGILWDNVSSPNFGFAHSAGDAMACIINDPGSNELDRFDTFPYVQDTTNIGRRHDRDVTTGWAWFGNLYNTQYQGEQILSTTLFRLYRSLGGDAVNLNTQIRASETTMNLIFGGTGLLTSTTTFPEVFVSNLQNTDLTTTSFKGVPGGALHKVVRWAFEQQGLYHPDAYPGSPTPVSQVGNPPDVDVYIDDGRAGGYEYQWNHWSCQDMWVRRFPDGGLAHEDPVVNVPNYMYVRVKNRGLFPANNVRVDAYSCLPGTGLVFPDHWNPMTTASLPASSAILPGNEEILGPFEFTPTQVGHECLLAIAHADGDPGNDTTLTGSIDHARFVPFDNNVGQRNVNPVPALTGGFSEALEKLIFWVRNPKHAAAVVEIEIRVPRLLQELGWSFDVKSEGGRKFELSGRQKLKVALSVNPGKEISRRDLNRAIKSGDSTIEVVALVDGEISGGMSFPLDPNDQGKQKPDVPVNSVNGIISKMSVDDILRIIQGKDNLSLDKNVKDNSFRKVRSITLNLEED